MLTTRIAMTTPVPIVPAPVPETPLSVALPADPLERIGVAFDESPAARSALVVARRLALATGAQLVLLAAGPTSQRAAIQLNAARRCLDRQGDYEARALVGVTSAAASA